MRNDPILQQVRETRERLLQRSTTTSLVAAKVFGKSSQDSLRESNEPRRRSRKFVSDGFEVTTCRPLAIGCRDVDKLSLR
jgi:hypothetical protein